MAGEPPRPPRPPREPTPPTEATRPLGAPIEPREPVATERVVERVPPEWPPEERWWENPWPAVAAGILGLIVGGLIGYAVADNGEGSSEPDRATLPAQTVTRTRTVVQPKVVERDHTVTATTQTPAPANSAGEERAREAESDLRTVERENSELKRQLEER
jgi:hypothetical protein